MDHLISRILLIGGSSTERVSAIAALARTGANLIIANDAGHAIEELARCAETPQLIIQHLDYSHEPLKFYRFIRGNVALRHIPFLFVVETAFEKATLSTLNLTHYFTVPSPLTYGLLIYALPALGMKLKDSILYEVPDAAVKHRDIPTPKFMAGKS